MSPDADPPVAPRTAARRGLLLVISGPSGSGKSTVCHELLRRVPDAVWSVSATTRAPRGQEADGRDYYFVSRQRFEEMVRAGELLEWAEYVGNLYGTPREPVEKALAAGRVVVMEIDVQGGRQIAERMPDSVRVFLLPPSDEELRRRLAGRRTDTPEQQQKRLAAARQEIERARQWSCYRYFLVNETVERTVQDVIRIVEAERNKV
jgi:guanylate kinase